MRAYAVSILIVASQSFVPRLALAAAVSCSGSQPKADPSTFDRALLELDALEEWSNDPRKVGAALLDADATPYVKDSLLPSACAGAAAANGVSGCRAGDIVLHPDGSIDIPTTSTPSSARVCFQDQPPRSWPATMYVVTRPAAIRDSSATCALVQHNQSIPLDAVASKSSPTVRLSVFAVRSAPPLKFDEIGLSLFRRAQVYLQNWLWSSWQTAALAELKSAPPGEALAATLNRAYAKFDARVNADIGPLATRDPALAAAIHLSHGEKSLSKVVATTQADINSFLGTLSDPKQLCSDYSTALPPIDYKAALAIALAAPPPNMDTEQFPIFEGDLPSVPMGDQPLLIALRSGEGENRTDIHLWGGKRILLFGHDMRKPALTVKAVDEGGKTKTKTESTDADTTSGKSSSSVTGDSLGFIKGAAIPDKISDLTQAVAGAFYLLVKATGSALTTYRYEASIGTDCKELELQKSRVSCVVNALAKEIADAFGKLSATERNALLAKVFDERQAKYTSKVLYSSVLDEGYTYKFQICTQGTCDDKATEDAISASIIVTSRKHHLCASTATEVAGNVGSEPIAGYRFEPVGGVTGPDQLYQLRQRKGLLDHITFSQLLVVYPFCRYEQGGADALSGLALGVGASVFTGDDVAFLKQWAFRIGWEPPFARGLLVMAGVSVRVVEEPTGNFSPGVIVPVDRAANTVPTFSQREAAVPLFSFGIALDLAILGKIPNLFASSSNSASSPAASSSTSQAAGSQK